MIIMSTRSIRYAAVVALISFLRVDAFVLVPRSHQNSVGITTWRSSSSLRLKVEGCAAKPLEKKKIAVFGAGGYLGAVIFGFVQRAASLYGTGVASGQSPRAICATGSSSEALNKVLGSSFKLAYAGEDLVRLVDTSELPYIQERLKGFDVAILGTTYQLERRSVTLNTYEKSPNDKTFEFYLDERYGAWENDIPSNDSSIHTTMFRNSILASKQAGIKHVVVVETPRTVKPMDFVSILEEVGIAYTYIRTNSPLKKDITYTFEKGISNKLMVTRLPSGSTLSSVDDTQQSENEQVVRREDLAALVVQSFMTLNWGESRILEVKPSADSSISSGFETEGSKRNKGQRYDKEWCPNSKLLAEALSSL